MRTLLFLIISTVIPSVFSGTATVHELSFFKNNTVPTPIKVEDGSKIYLSSRDKALQLSKITLHSNGNTITLDKMLSMFDSDSFTVGWPVNSDLTITTTNLPNVTSELKGELFIATPTMAADPNFLVYGVRGSKIIDKSTAKGKSTIVFLSSFNQNTNGNPNYAGFRHIRMENIVQPLTSEIFLYRNQPDDYYSDTNNANTTKKMIFSNPLKHNTNGNPNSTFFQSIDPMQFSESFWLRAIGGFTLNVSDTYVDTTNITTGAVTVTGMSNSQLLTTTSQVIFNYQGGNRYGGSGYVVSSDLFGNSNLTLQLSGADPLFDSYTVNGNQNVFNQLREPKWNAVNLALKPSGLFTGIYYLQYFNIDNGPVTVAPTQALPTTATVTSAAPVVTSSAPPAVASSSSGSSTPTPAPQSTSPTVQTTTSTSATSLVIISMLATLLNNVLNH